VNRLDENAGNARAEVVKNWDDEPSAKEAWAVMIYVCDDCRHKERIWNARPHVTPFGGVPCPACPGTMTHAFFGSDVAMPDYRPVKGELIFIDTPPELALISAKRVIDRYGSREDLPDSPSAEKLALSNLADFGGHPPSCIRLLS
jgi:hypothetical protein